MIEKLYCISLKDNQIRRNFMTEQLDKLYPGKYKMVDACTINDNKVVESYNNLLVKKSNIDALSQIAICYSHIKCLKKIISRGYTFGGIIEDDIRIDPNIETKIDLYIKNTPGLIDCMNKEPCIIHICGPSNFINRDCKFIDRDNHIIVNICFYIVNYKLAKILVDNFYPIRWQFDTYVSKIMRKYNIKEFIARPILAWDLSSTLYSKFWSKEDIAVRKHIFSTSKIEKLDKTNIKPNILFNKDDPYEYFFIGILNIKKKNTYHTCIYKSKLHYMSSTSDISNIGIGTIVAGQGINTINQVISTKPFTIMFVRGPLTMNCFKKSNICCPDIYLEPLILFKYIEKKNKNCQKKHTKYLIITNYDIDQSYKDNRILFININNIDISTICQQLYYSDIVISNIYCVLVIAGSLNKTVIPIKNYDGDFCIKYIDYLLGYDNIVDNYKSDSLEYSNICDILLKINNNSSIYYPQVDQIELNNKCEHLCNILPYSYNIL